MFLKTGFLMENFYVCGVKIEEITTLQYATTTKVVLRFNEYFISNISTI